MRLPRSPRDRRRSRDVARADRLPPPLSPLHSERGRPPDCSVITIYRGDNLDVLATFADASFDFIYIDPPFNTGRAQRRDRLRTTKSARGTRRGFGGHRYTAELIGTSVFADRFDDYAAFLAPRLLEARRVLTTTGGLMVHLDYREVHYVKVMLDSIFDH